MREALRGLRLSAPELAEARERQPKLRSHYHEVKPGALFDTVHPNGPLGGWWNFIRLDGDRPAFTVTTAPSLFHPDEPRLLTISEVRRLCSFPEDFTLKAVSYSQRWERYGRAVPPLMMFAVAAVVRNALLRRDGRRWEGNMAIGARYVPYTMADVVRVPRNGLSVISTFSGCGGSSLGYKLAGFDVRAASEFDTEAADTYEANFPRTPVSRKDIREMTGADLFALARMRPGTLDVLDGSPPCASFSMAGNRDDDWNVLDDSEIERFSQREEWSVEEHIALASGKVKNYSGQQQRTDDLFHQYARVLGEMKPRAFVAENVSGLTKGVAKGFFNGIQSLLRSKGYVVGSYLLDASLLGVPQKRERVFFVGFRNDLGVTPTSPRPIGGTPVTLREVLQGVPRSSDPEEEVDAECSPGTSMHFLTRQMAPGEDGQDVINRIESGEVKLMDSDGKFVQLWKERGLPNGYFSARRLLWDAPASTVQASHGRQGAACGQMHPDELRKLRIPELRRVCSFPEDFRLTGPFHQRWERLGRSVPPFMMRVIAERVARLLRGAS